MNKTLRPISQHSETSTMTRKATMACLLAGIMATPMVVAAASPVTNYEYDANDNLTKTTDGNGNATTQQYDAVNHLIQQNQPNPTSTGQLGIIKNQYNILDGATSITDPRNLATTYTRNAYGEVTKQVSPDTGTTTFVYTGAGLLNTKTDARGAVSTYTPDNANRITQITYTLGGVTDETVTFSYDQRTFGKGRLTGMTDLSGSTAWTYDDQGHVVRKQQQIGTRVFNLDTQYDTAGRLARIVYPSSRYVDYQYNANGQISQVLVDGNVMLANIQYHATGAIKGWTWGNGQTYSRNIDGDGRIASLSLGDQLQVINYDNAGRITQLYRANPATPSTPDANTTDTYGYDNLNRLTLDASISTQGYQYDLSDNRTALTLGANTYPYTIATTSNRITAEAGPTARSYTYDLAGNITGNGQDTYTYYNSGRLKQVTRASTNIYSLVYNGLGQFVSRTNNSTRYLYDESGHLVGEYNSSGDLIEETVWLGDMPVMTLRPDSLQRTADNSDTAATNFASVTGTWTAATTINGFYGTNYVTHAAAVSTPDYVVYSITPTATQNYRVYTRWVAQATNATNATYIINPNTPGSTPTTVTVDQTQSGGVWVYLGSFDLNTANNLTVSLSGQGNGTVVADAVRIVPNAPSSIQNVVYFVHADQLNTPRVIKDYVNRTRWYWYPELAEAFGANIPNENPSGLGTFTYNLRFPGQLYDPASGLSYNYFRDYNSRTGRYVESDPIGLAAGQMSTYAYVGGNPMSYVDPKGLSGCRVVGAVVICDIGTPPPGDASGFPWPDSDRQKSMAQQMSSTISGIADGIGGAVSSAAQKVKDAICKTGVSEHDEAECLAQYERDLEECSAYFKVYGSRWYASCTTNAFARYQKCRGY